MIENFHPDQNDKDIQKKLYEKREFYYYKAPEQKEYEDYEEIAELRKNICKSDKKELLNHQALLSNFINPSTPYKSLLLIHSTGTGKCITKNSFINGEEKTIKEIWDKYKTDIFRDNENGEWTKPLKKINVKTLNNKGQIIQGNVIHLYREYVNTYLYKIYLTNDTHITKTYIHKLYNYDLKVWQNVFNIGDRIAIYNELTEQMEGCEITRIEQILHKEYVYDLEVEEYHNFIANDILCHNTIAALAITEKFKQQVIKYKTQIYILVPGPLLKQQWKDSILEAFGNEYMKIDKNYSYLSDEDKEKIKKQGMANVMAIYKIMSYSTFRKRVLGDRVIEKVVKDNKLKSLYRKTEDGEFERDMNMEPIINLNNTIIVCDEAHNLTGNTTGDALKKIIKNSINLRTILLTATPMKNYVDDIVELINFLRPLDAQMQRDKIFNEHKNHLMDFKEGGIEYLKKMASGYVSYFRGVNPLTFGERVEMGEVPDNLLFTHLTRCIMSDFQETAYNETIKDISDSLDKTMGSVANIIFPILDENGKDITGISGKDGMTLLKNQIKNNGNKLNDAIAKHLFNKSKATEEYVKFNDITNNISGTILKKENLKIFSTKFHQALLDIENELFSNNDIKTSRTGFVYSNLVKIGINLFQEILLQNGYLEYNENETYQINNDTKCYECGCCYDKHINKNHTFGPATFLLITGKIADVEVIVEQDEKQILIRKIFNNVENINGKKIKLILGSQVLTEGISMANVYATFILDAYFNFGRVEQIIGRAIRHCSHYNLMSKLNLYPKMKVFKYVISFKNKKDIMTTEEELYYKAEKKYMPIKKCERILATVAIDCPLNQQANMFKEEIKKYKDCVEPVENLLKKDIKKNEIKCPAKCNFTKCEYICDNEALNAKYYDPTRNIYKSISKDKLDYSTFTNDLAINEINYIKGKIKELYIIGYIYDLKTITKYVYDTYSKEKQIFFDDFFVQKALDELIPITENDFNNFTDTIYDKTFKSGYLIYLDGYYIFQPFNESEKLSLYYRTSYNFLYESKLSLKTYASKFLNIENNEEVIDDKYNFDNVMDYYQNKKEFDYVGIIDYDNILKEDIFKIRDKRSTVLDKKRGTGISTFMGSVCTYKSLEYLEKIVKKLKITPEDIKSRKSICNAIKEKLVEMERNATGENKKTYIIIPENHPNYIFPLNYEDRIEMIKKKLSPIKFKNFKITENKNTIIVSFNIENITREEEKKIIDLGFINEDKNNKWTLTIKE
jgi:superfamily II DNA or RNA helicase